MSIFKNNCCANETTKRVLTCQFVHGKDADEICERAIAMARAYEPTGVLRVTNRANVERACDSTGRHYFESANPYGVNCATVDVDLVIPAKPKPAKLTHVVFEYGYDRHDLESKVLRTAAIYFGVGTRSVRIVSGESRANTSLRDGASKAFYGTFVTALADE